MKWLAAFAVLVVLGLAGVVITHESGRGGPGGSSLGSRGGGATVATISHGETVRIEDHLRDGVYTIVEFTADW